MAGMDPKMRGWLNIIGALVAGYFVWSGNTAWSIYVLALLSLISGFHHVSSKRK